MTPPHASTGEAVLVDAPSQPVFGASSWLTPMDTDERRFQTHTLSAFIGLLFLLFSTSLILDLRWERVGVVLPFLIAAMGLVLSRFLMRGGDLRWAWSVLLLVCSCYLLRGAYLGGGIYSHHTSALLLVLVVAGRMLGPRLALAAAVALALAMLGLAAVPDVAPALAAAGQDGPMRRAIAYAMQCAALGCLCWYMFGHNAQQIIKLQSAGRVAQASAREAQRATERFEAMFRASPTAMAILGGEAGALTDCNAAMERLLGRPRDDLLGRSATALGLPDVCALVRADVDPLADAAPSPAGVPEVGVVAGDGTRRVCSFHAHALRLQGSLHVVLHMNDLTAGKRAERALQESERRFQDFARASGDWFWETDAAGRFVWMSDAFEAHAGMSPSVVYERTRAGLAAIDPATDREPWRSHLRILEAKQPFRDFVYPCQEPHGEQWFRSSGVPVFDAEGSFCGYRGIGLDVTARILAEQRATQADALLSAAVEELDEAFLMCDPQDRIVIANRRFREVNPEVVNVITRGGLFEDYLRAAVASGHHVEANGCEETFIQSRVERWRRGSAPFEGDRRDGQRMWVTVQKVSDGSTVMTLTDITTRKQAEEELRRGQRLLAQVIDAIPMAIFAKDLDSKYTLANRYQLDLLKTTREQLLGTHTLRVNAPEATRRATFKDDQWVFQHRVPLVQAVSTMQDADGRWVSFHSSKIPLFDDDRTLVGLLGVNRDISGELRAQEALRASEARFSALFHRSVVPQVVVGYNGDILGEDVNQAFVELTGYPRERLLPGGNEHLVLFATQQDRERIHEVLQLGDTERPMDIHIIRADGALRTLQASAFQFDTPAGMRMACAFVDVTDQRDAQRQMSDMNRILEQSVRERTDALTHSNAELQMALRDLKASQAALIQAEKLAALGRVVAGVAHELNTPIGNSLLSSTTLADATEGFVSEIARGLRRSRLDSYVAVATEASAILQRNLERAAELVRGFKQLAVDQTSSQRRRFALSEVIHEIALAHRPALRRAGGELNLDIADAALELDSYPGPLGQVITNLIDNALLHGYADRAPGAIEIKAAGVGPDQVLLTVCDFGRGIALDDQGRVFDPFFTTRLGKGGSGLGLHIVHNIVRDVLGGRISLASTPGEGTCFSLLLPRDAPVRREGADPSPSPAGS